MFGAASGNNIVPKTITKAIRESIKATYQVAEDSAEYKIESGETLEQTIEKKQKGL